MKLEGTRLDEAVLINFETEYLRKLRAGITESVDECLCILEQLQTEEEHSAEASLVSYAISQLENKKINVLVNLTQDYSKQVTNANRIIDEFKNRGNKLENTSILSSITGIAINNVAAVKIYNHIKEVFTPEAQEQLMLLFFGSAQPDINKIINDYATTTLAAHLLIKDKQSIDFISKVEETGDIDLFEINVNYNYRTHI